jgi:hypothetical protein
MRSINRDRCEVQSALQLERAQPVIAGALDLEQQIEQGKRGQPHPLEVALESKQVRAVGPQARTSPGF